MSWTISGHTQINFIIAISILFGRVAGTNVCCEVVAT